MWWSEFERQVPDFAHEIRERLEGPGIVLVGTTRRDGSSRISPVEPVFEQKRPGEIDRISLNATQASKVLGWEPRIDFREGVKRVVADWRQKLGRG